MGKSKSDNPLPKPKAKLHVELNLRSLDSVPDARETLIKSILQLAPQSPLYVKQGMKDAVVALGTSFDDFKQTGAALGALRKQINVLEQSWADKRNVNDNCLLLVKTLTEGNAATEADINSMAFKMRVLLAMLAEVPPVESIDVQMGKKASGRVTCLAHETGTTRWYYAAEASPDPYGPNTWLTLIGEGKQRKLSGKSGTSSWVRFARKRGDKQSEWCTPVLITFP